MSAESSSLELCRGAACIRDNVALRDLCFIGKKLQDAGQTSKDVGVNVEGDLEAEEIVHTFALSNWHRLNGKIVIKSNVRLGQTSHCEREIPLNGNRAYLRITSDKDFYYILASSDGTNFTTLAKMEYRFLSTETIGGFTGVMLGLFTQCSQKTDGYVDVDWFEYN